MGLDVAGRYRYPPPDAAWLSLHDEPVLDPDLPIIDAHHHIWELDGHPYLLDELAEDLTSGHDVRATVAVQAHHGYRASGPEAFRCVGETELLDGVASEAERRGLAGSPCAAIVAFADLTDETQLDAVLDAHEAAAPERFRGVRHGVSRDSHFPEGIVLRPAPDKLLADPAYRGGLARLARRGLSYDAMLYHEQIPELAAAARALPELPIVLDHLGCRIGVGPYRGRESETFARWRDDMAELALCPNVSIKLGGLGMIICGADWHQRPEPPDSSALADAWRPAIETCVELFGAERCMFESNFPVDKAMFSYRVVWNAFKRLMRGASSAEKAWLFHDSAARFYRIEGR